MLSGNHHRTRTIAGAHTCVQFALQEAKYSPPSRCPGTLEISNPDPWNARACINNGDLPDTLAVVPEMEMSHHAIDIIPDSAARDSFVDAK